MEELSNVAPAPEVSDAQIDADIDAMMGDAEPAPEAETHDGSADAQITNQKDFNKALGARLGEERDRLTRRYENSPEYQLGKQMLAERMRRDNLSADDAYKAILDENIKAQAKQFKDNPEQFYEHMLRSQNQRQQVQQTPSHEQTAMNLTQQLIDAGNRGAMPENFTPQDITPEFISNAQAYGIDAALVMWSNRAAGTREDVVAELTRRQSMPVPMRSTGDNVAPRPVDFEHMSKEEFARYEAALKKRYG